MVQIFWQVSYIIDDKQSLINKVRNSSIHVNEKVRSVRHGALLTYIYMFVVVSGLFASANVT